MCWIGKWTCMQNVLFFMQQNNETEKVCPNHGGGERVVCLAEDRKGRKEREKGALSGWWHMAR